MAIKIRRIKKHFCMIVSSKQIPIKIKLNTIIIKKVQPLIAKSIISKLHIKENITNQIRMETKQIIFKKLQLQKHQLILIE
jgi:hypothetical protein